MNTLSHEIQLHELLKEKLGETGSSNLIGFVQKEVKEGTMQNTEHLATKADLERTQGRLILWSFAFWVTQLAAIFLLLK